MCLAEAYERGPRQVEIMASRVDEAKLAIPVRKHRRHLSGNRQVRKRFQGVYTESKANRDKMQAIFKIILTF